jgi:glycosyltransferase involved in cell wall biosynthesis
MSRVLMLSSFPVYPTNDGGRARIHSFARNLTAEHEVTVVCSRLPERPKERLPYRLLDIAGSGPRRQLFDPGFLRRLVSLIRKERPDVLLLEYVWQGVHATIASALTATPLVVDAFDVVTTRFRRQHHPLLPVITLYERIVLRRAERVFAISDVDLQGFRALGISDRRLSLLPGGVDVDVFHPDPDARDRVRKTLRVGDDRLLFFFGQLDYAPNADALSVLAKEIVPRLPDGCQLAIAGRGNVEQLRSRYGSARTRFLGPVDSIADHINAADAVVSPIRIGSGTRHKLLETIACGVPAVSTTIGAEGIDNKVLRPAVLIRDEWATFAEAACDAATWPRLQPSAAFLANHDWRTIVKSVRL